MIIKYKGTSKNNAFVDSSRHFVPPSSKRRASIASLFEGGGARRASVGVFRDSHKLKGFICA